MWCASRRMCWSGWGGERHPNFMPKTPLQINLETLTESVASICITAGLKGKELGEVHHSLDAVRAWRDRFECLHGNLEGCIHHSNPDDPPDLTLCFGAAYLEVEHTRLTPPVHGWVDALRRKECSNQTITVPSITFQPKNRQDLLSAMLARGGGWSDASADFKEWLRYTLGVIQKKIENRSTGILVSQDTSLIFEGQLTPIAEVVHGLLSPRSDLLQNWTILIHSRSNSLQFLSYLIAANEELQIRKYDGLIGDGIN